MLVRSLCKHYDKELREEGEQWEHSGLLYEHIVPVEEPAEDTAEPTQPPSRQQKPARTR